MSATPPANPTTPAAYPEPTQADHDAMFASVVWFRTNSSTGIFDKYLGMHVAILGEQVIDADRDKDALLLRLDALGDAISQNRVVLQYLPTVEELLQY